MTGRYAFTVSARGLRPQTVYGRTAWRAGLGGQRDTDGPGPGVADRIAAVSRPTQKCFELERRLGGSRLAAYSPRADGSDDQGGHDQHGVQGDGGVEPDLGFIKPGCPSPYFRMPGASRRIGPAPTGVQPRDRTLAARTLAPEPISRQTPRPVPKRSRLWLDAENVEVE